MPTTDLAIALIIIANLDSLPRHLYSCSHTKAPRSIALQLQLLVTLRFSSISQITNARYLPLPFYCHCHRESRRLLLSFVTFIAPSCSAIIVLVLVSLHFSSISNHTTDLGFSLIIASIDVLFPPSSFELLLIKICSQSFVLLNSTPRSHSLLIRSHHFNTTAEIIIFTNVGDLSEFEFELEACPLLTERKPTPIMRSRPLLLPIETLHRPLRYFLFFHSDGLSIDLRICIALNTQKRIH
jgi:hypothetical protein